MLRGLPLERRHRHQQWFVRNETRRIDGCARPTVHVCEVPDGAIGMNVGFSLLVLTALRFGHSLPLAPRHRVDESSALMNSEPGASERVLAC